MCVSVCLRKHLAISTTHSTMRAVLARCSRSYLTKAYAKPTILRPSNARNASVATLPSGLAIPTTADIDAFRAIVGEANVLVNADAVVKYNRDWLKQYHGSTPAVIRPKTTAEVSAIMKHCNSRRIAVVPQGKPPAASIGCADV